MNAGGRRWLRRGRIGLVLELLGLTLRRRLVVVEIDGASMKPTLLPGDRLICARGNRIHLGAIVVVRQEGGTYFVKRVTALSGVVRHGHYVAPGYIWLEGDNPASSADSRHFGPFSLVRGALEAAHHRWHMEDPANHKLELNSMRRLQKWPIRHFKGAWRLLGSNEEFLAYSDVALDNDQSRAALLTKGYTPCALPTCKRLIKNMEQHMAAHESGLLNEEGRRTDRAN